MPEERPFPNWRRLHHRYDSLVLENSGAFGWYQIRLLLISQLPYLAVTGSMLCTIFDNIIPVGLCNNSYVPSSLSPRTIFQSDDHNATTGGDANKTVAETDVNGSHEFDSLIVRVGLACSGSYFPTLMVTLVMAGGTLGASIFGFAADRRGRRFTSILGLVGVCLGNLMLLGSVHIHWTAAAMSLFTLGVFGAGYMVVNLVLLLENVGKSWRLFCVSVHGWPLGFMGMALIGYAAGRWDYYHFVLALLCVPSIVGHFFIYESPRWLIQCGRVAEAERIIHQICRINGRCPLLLLAKAAEAGSGHDHQDKELVIDDNDDDVPTARDLKRQPSTERKYAYADLFRSRSVFLRLAAMSYCWFSGAIVSFGILFNMEALAGDRYLNTFFTGFLKGTTGVIPLLLSPWFGRKPIFAASVLGTCISCWAAVIVYAMEPTNNGKSMLLTACALFGIAAMDPMWKINQLYSAELFPTVVRNMSRAVCNMWARVGAMIAPQIAFLSIIYFPLPFIVYGVFAVVQFIVALWLPETKGKPLSDRLPSASRRNS